MVIFIFLLKPQWVLFTNSMKLYLLRCHDLFFQSQQLYIHPVPSIIFLSFTSCTSDIENHSVPRKCTYDFVHVTFDWTFLFLNFNSIHPARSILTFFSCHRRLALSSLPVSDSLQYLPQRLSLIFKIPFLLSSTGSRFIYFCGLAILSLNSCISALSFVS